MKELVQASVGIMILDGEKVLFGKRLGEQGSFCWGFPGGKMEVGETFEECAKRETFEETGLILLDVEVMCLNLSPSGKYANVGLLCKKFSGVPEGKEPDKHPEWKWFSLKDLPENIFLQSLHMIKNFKEKKFYMSSLK